MAIDDHYWLTYTTRDGEEEFEFVFWELVTGWRIYIISDIDYGNHNTGSHPTHRLFDSGDTYHYICWSTSIDTLEEAKAVAAKWSEITHRYKRKDNRNTFDEIAEYLNNPRRRRLH